MHQRGARRRDAEQDRSRGQALGRGEQGADPGQSERADEFLAAMAFLGRSRQRTGAMEWRLYRDVGTVDRFVEAFVVRSWAEHMHQHQVRLTARDREIEQAVVEYSAGPQTVSHLVAVEPG